ncbi:TRAP transporter substrate-binding protein [Anaerosphaera multitolerans]|uniref:TRAP transporter substrate-binding protein n=1 Tax=Anaerosphaera multitolerans TaxID=2487351 RepID=A0A437S727_9FIRM|nr:TRAP transporter substrate-binding protein [Anaerosphaera multitolerans]RVU54717.1 TRAP transporter substrate-binding protein [Anaerosphaera multitolerans]
MKKKMYLLITSLVLLSLLLVGCGGGNKSTNNQNEASDTTKTNTGAVTIKIGHVEPEDRSTHKTLLDFKKNVEEQTNGDIIVEIYPNASLGGDVQLTESVAMGTLDVALPSSSVLTTYAEDFGILDMPYLFKNSESAFNALDGDVGKYFDEKLADQGMHNLGYTYNGPRSTTTNNKPIEKPEDLKGVKVRVMESPIFIDYYKTLGANPTPMSFNELYTGLQQGTVDAQENPPSLIFANKFFEVQEYLSVDEHVHNFLAFVMNKAKFESLTPEQQEIITAEGKKCVESQRKMELEDNEVAIEKLETEGGLVVNRLSEEQKNEFKEALKPMYDKYREQFGAELFEMCEKYNK